MAAPKLVEINAENARLSDFDLFWECFPRKRAKLDALKAWQQTKDVRPPIEQILAAIEDAIQGGEWSDERYVPYPATWLRRGQFLDE